MTLRIALNQEKNANIHFFIYKKKFFLFLRPGDHKGPKHLVACFLEGHLQGAGVWKVYSRMSDHCKYAAEGGECASQRQKGSC